ncbi:MAG: class I SAM-dependent RNA methyltransferase [Bacteroidales bacterium]
MEQKNKNRERFEMVAKTFRGLESLLAGELEAIGGGNIRTGFRVVYFDGDIEVMYRANFQVRTALRILKPFYEFRAKNDEELYNGAYSFDWSGLLTENSTFAVNGVVSSPYFNHSKFIALRVKDAIADQFRAKTGKRPDVDTENPDVRINLHVSSDRCTLLLDSSGDSLHKRGYRTTTVEAPINEVLAAGMIMLSGWDRESAFIDPMCGSGTIPIEAAMMAYNIPPGIYRKQFAFEKWPDFDKDLFNNIYNEEYPEPKVIPEIVGSDMSPQAVAMAKTNAKNAFMGKKIDFKVSAFEEMLPPANGGMLITNPPYGERLKQENIKAFHMIMGDYLKKNFTGYTAWILSSNIEALKFTGLRPEQKIVLYNGPLECRFVKFSIYKGTKKTHKLT